MKLTITEADTAGYKIQFEGDPNDYYYVGTYFRQGYVYKDRAAFESGKGVCYIAECNFLPNSHLNGFLSKEMTTYLRLNRNTAHYVSYSGYTRNDIVKIIDAEINKEKEWKESMIEENKELFEKFMDYMTLKVFDTLDWQRPQTYVNELYFEDEEWEEFLKTQKPTSKIMSFSLSKRL